MDGYGDKRQEAVVHHNLGNIAKAETHYKRALKHYRKAAKNLFDIGELASRASSYNAIGRLAAKAHQRKMARLYYRRAPNWPQ